MRGTTALVVAGVIAALVAFGTVLDRVVPDPRSPSVEQAPRQATAGAWVCAAGNTEDESTLESIAAAPPREGGEPASLRVTPFRGGRSLGDVVTQVFPNSAVSTAIDAEAIQIGLLERWWDVPAAVTRVWNVRVQGAPSGIVAGPCQRRPSDRWVVPGVATAGGAQSQLVLANPFVSAASVAIDLTTPDGIVSPKRLENIVIPERSTVTVPLNEHAPEQPDLGAIVSARAGRVIVEAVQTFDAAIGGIEGTSLVAAAPEPAETWTVTSIGTTEAVSSWLWVTNPSDEPAALLLALHTPEGGLVPEGIGELVVDPGVTRRVELVGLLGEDPTEAAVTVTSDNSVPFVVSGATQFRAENEERTGITVALGSPVLDPTWILSPGPTSGRRLIIDLVNPSAQPAVLDLSIWTGAGLERPEDLQGVDVPAGGLRAVDVTPHLIEGAGPVTVFAGATEGSVVAGLRASAGEGRRDAVSFVGIPQQVFEVAAGAPAVRFAPDLATRLGTRLGPTEPTDPLLVDDDEPFDEPTP